MMFYCLTAESSIEEMGIPKTKLRVKGLPPGATTELLCSFFENERRQGGGPVRNVYIAQGGNVAIVEFEEASG